MKALVTGGGGFLGLYVTEQLVARGDSVRVLCRGQYPCFDQLKVDHVQGDIRDAETVRRACEGVDTVFHVAAVPGIWGPWKMFHGINTQGTLNVIEACRAQKVPKLVYTSSPSVIYDGAPHENVDETYPYPRHFLCHYPHSKALAERAVLMANRRDGLLTVSLRPHLIWGPRDNHLIPRLIRRAKAGRLMRVGNGRNLISMSYVENVAAAHLQAADALAPGSRVAGQAYFINEPEPVNLWSWVDDLLRRAGLPTVRRSMSAKSAWRIGLAMESTYRAFGIRREPLMTRFLALQLSDTHYYDVSKAKRDFGYTPSVTVQDGLSRIDPELRALAR